jgi:hypothetical protein
LRRAALSHDALRLMFVPLLARLEYEITDR